MKYTKKTSSGIGTVPIIIIVVIAILIFVLLSGGDETSPTVPTNELQKQAAKDLQEQISKQQADAMLDSVQKADPRFGGGVELDEETKRQLQEAQQFQNNY